MTWNNLLIYVIESPSEKDIFERIEEGSILVDALNLIGIEVRYRKALSRSFFIKSLIDFIDICKNDPDVPVTKLPILHISAHGNEKGIKLSNEDRLIEWSWLESHLSLINKVLGNRLVVCMSTCRGASACEMFMKEIDNNEPSFYALIGTIEDISWSDTLVGYLSFYHLLSKGLPPVKAVKSMRHAAGHSDFLFVTGTIIRKIYLNNLIKEKEKELEHIKEEIEEFKIDEER